MLRLFLLRRAAKELLLVEGTGDTVREPGQVLVELELPIGHLVADDLLKGEVASQAFLFLETRQASRMA